MKFRLKEDWVFGKSKILDKGSIIEPNQDFKYEITYLGTTMYLSLDDIESNNIFEPYDIVIDIKELEVDEIDNIKNYRIQMDVKTSFRKLKIIEEFLKETINNML